MIIFIQKKKNIKCFQLERVHIPTNFERFQSDSTGSALQMENNSRINFVIQKVLFHAKGGILVLIDLFLNFIKYSMNLPWKTLHWNRSGRFLDNITFSNRKQACEKSRKKNVIRDILLDYIIVSLNRFELCAI